MTQCVIQPVYTAPRVWTKRRSGRGRVSEEKGVGVPAHVPFGVTIKGGPLEAAAWALQARVCGPSPRKAHEPDFLSPWPGKVVAGVQAVGPFWEAEPEHQDYLERYPKGYTCHYPRPGWRLPKRA